MHFRRPTLIAAANFTRGRIKKIRLIVLHSDEVLETKTNAEGTANFFRNQPKSSQTGSSAQVVVDADSEVRCVRDRDTAWAAPEANADGLHIEQAGYAAQGRKGWKDDYSRRVIRRAAHRAARWCIKYKIRPYPVTDPQLADRVTTGITTHAQVTRVLNAGVGHTDPGDYPMHLFITDLHEQLARSWRGRRLLRRYPAR